MSPIFIGIAIMFVGIGVAIVLGMATASEPGVVKNLKKCLTQQVEDIKRLAYEDIQKLCEQTPESIVSFGNQEFIRRLILNEVDCTGAKFAADPYMLLKVQIIVSSKNQKHSEYEFLSKKRSTREGLYSKGKK